MAGCSNPSISSYWESEDGRLLPVAQSHFMGGMLALKVQSRVSSRPVTLHR